jgi:epoxyqueuosine reductase
LRNVAVALGNSKSHQAVPALIRALDDDEALVRGHVAWALGQIGLNDGMQALEKRLRKERDPTVRMEIEDAIEHAANLAETETGVRSVEP